MHDASPTRDYVRLSAIKDRLLAGVLGCFLLVLLAEISSLGAETYQIEGEVSINYPAMATERSSLFKVRVQGDRWHFILHPKTWRFPDPPPGRPKIPVPALYQISSDTTNVYELRSYKEGDLIEGEPLQIAEKWPGKLLEGRSSYQEIYALWYAFGSSGVLATNREGSLPSLTPGRAWMYGQYRSEQGIPVWVSATEEGRTHKWVYNVESFTNVGSLRLPDSLRVEYMRTVRPTNAGVLTVRVTSLKSKPNLEGFVLSLNEQPTMVYDTRGESVVRLTADDWVPSNAFNALHENVSRAAEKRDGDNAVGKRSIVFWALGSVPAILLIGLLCKRRWRR